MNDQSNMPSKKPAKVIQLKRERGPSYPQHKPNGRWMAESYMPHRSRYLRTFHDSEAQAHKRLAGNRLHTGKRVIDTQPPKAG